MTSNLKQNNPYGDFNNVMNIRKGLPNKCRTYNYTTCANHPNCIPRRATRPSAKIYRPASCAARSGFASRPLTESEFLRLQSNGYQPNPAEFGNLISTIRDPTTGRSRQVYYDPRYYLEFLESQAQTQKQKQKPSSPLSSFQTQFQSPTPSIQFEREQLPSSLPFISERSSPLPFIPEESFSFSGESPEIKRTTVNNTFAFPATSSAPTPVIRNQIQIAPVTRKQSNSDWDKQMESDLFLKDLSNCTNPKYDKMRRRFLDEFADASHKTIPKEFYLNDNIPLACDAIDLIYKNHYGEVPQFSSNPNYFKNYPREIVDWWQNINSGDEQNEDSGDEQDEQDEQDEHED